MLYDFNYMTFWKKQNHKDTKKDTQQPNRGWGEGVMNRQKTAFLAQ